MFDKDFKPARGLVRLWFPDGTTLAGNDFHDVLARLGRLQWEPCDVPTMKAKLSDRGYAWNRSLIDPLLSDGDFLRECQRAKLFRVETSPEKAS